MRISELYQTLVEEYSNELKGNAIKYGMPTSIRDNTINTNKGQFEYEEIISTIPLDKLLDLMKIEHDLDNRDEHVYLVRSNDLNFENARSLLVVDENIDFHKVTKVGKQHYIFYSFHELNDEYFSLFMENFEILNKTTIEQSFPLGQPPNLDFLEKEYNIYCIGSSAQWDYFMDIASCLNRIAPKVDAQ